MLTHYKNAFSSTPFGAFCG